MKIQFTDVGPRKLSWTANLSEPLTHRALVAQIRKHHALGSRGIDFADNGGIYVGVFRRVGTWGEALAVDAVATLDEVGNADPSR